MSNSTFFSPPYFLLQPTFMLCRTHLPFCRITPHTCFPFSLFFSSSIFSQNQRKSSNLVARESKCLYRDITRFIIPKNNLFTIFVNTFHNISLTQMQSISLIVHQIKNYQNSWLTKEPIKSVIPAFISAHCPFSKKDFRVTLISHICISFELSILMSSNLFFHHHHHQLHRIPYKQYQFKHPTTIL